MRDTKQKLTFSFIATVLLSLSACGGGGGSSSNTTAVATDVTLERGKVYGATVVDSSMPKQTAVQISGKNIYRFAKTPTYPISATGGWIDVNGNEIKDLNDTYLDIVLKSYSSVITPVTTYIADSNQTIREQNLQRLKQRLNAPGVGSDQNLTDQELLGLASQANNFDVVLLTNAIYKEMKEQGGTLDFSDDDSILSQFFSIENYGTTLVEVEQRVMSDLNSSGDGSYIPPSDLQDTNNTHSFIEGNSFDISQTITGTSMIQLFKNDDADTELLLTFFSSGGATLQYVQNSSALWQSSDYTYVISGNTITATLPVGGGIDLGPQPAPQQVILTLDDTIVTAHVGASVDGVDYTVFYANGVTTAGNNSGVWSKTQLTAPPIDTVLSDDGTTLVGVGFSDFSLHSYNVNTKATSDLVTDANGNTIQCTAKNDDNRDVIQIDQTNTQFAFVCSNSINGLGADDSLDHVYLYDSTADSYTLISPTTLEWDANAPFISSDAQNLIYYTKVKQNSETYDAVLQYNVNTGATQELVAAPYGMKLWAADSSLEHIVYIKNTLVLTTNPPQDHQELIVKSNGTESVIGDFQQNIEGSMQFVDARITRDGSKIFYITGNLYDPDRTGLQSLYLYDVATQTSTLLAANFYHDTVQHYSWDISENGSKVVFNLDTPWGDTQEDTDASEQYIYIFDVSTKTYEMILSDDIQGVVAAPDFSKFYSEITGYKLVEISQ